MKQKKKLPLKNDVNTHQEKSFQDELASGAFVKLNFWYEFLFYSEIIIIVDYSAQADIILLEKEKKNNNGCH